MTDTALTTTARQAITPKANKPPLRVKGKLRIALKAIVWEGQDIADAARTAGMTGHAVRCALDRPHVLAFIRNEREVLRAYVSAQNIHHARNLRNTSDNDMAKLGAMKLIEQLGTESVARSAGSLTLPGLTIQIIQQVGSAAIEPPLTDVTDKALK